MNWLTTTDLPLKGLKLVTRRRAFDHRGFLSRIFCVTELVEAGWTKPVIQVNHSYTARSGTIRGMHYQTPPHTEMKCVTCIRGEVFDVAVDVRYGSTSFLKWHGERLSAEHGEAMLIPEGFAHGFQALTDDVELIYFHSAGFAPDAEGVINPLDPGIAVDWPLPVKDIAPRDSASPMLTDSFAGIRT